MILWESESIEWKEFWGTEGIDVVIMERNIPSYAIALAENNLDILEDIITNRYVEFIDFYWMLRDYTEYIQHLKMKERKSGLKISISLFNLDLDDVENSLRNNIPEKSNCEIEREDDMFIITLYKK